MSAVSIVEGEEPEDMVSEAMELLGGIDKFIRFGDVVFIKPNVCGGVIGKRGSYTSSEVIVALIELIKDQSSRIIVGEADSEMYDVDRRLNEIADVVKAFPPHLSVVDATVGMEGEGPFKGNPVALNLIICGDNAVAADSVTASILGYKPAKIKHLELAAKSGLGPVNLEEIDIECEKEAKRGFKKVPGGIRFGSRFTDFFRSLIPEKGLSNFFHNYYLSAVEEWRKKKE
jgi:uncharacterized protein (DUF362 family)